MRIVRFSRTACRFLIFLVALLPLPVLAGGSAIFKSDDGDTEILWQTDGAVRVGQTGSQEYMLMRDGKAYMVSHEDGEAQVMEMTGIVQAMGDMANSSADLPIPETVDSVKATGKSETIAGVKGEIHLITTTEKDGTTSTMEAVLTDKPIIVEMTRSYMQAIGSIVGAQSIETFTQALPAKKSGILRVDDDFVLKSISDQEPQAGMFELPANPINLNDLMKGLQNLMKQ